MPIKIVIDTDIGEDIDDILVTAFALISPEFEVLAVTTVDGDTDARSRITRRLTATVGRPDVPVVAGYQHSMPRVDLRHPAGAGVRQGEIAPDEAGLPPACDLPADELIATLAADHPGEVHVLTIGSMTNIGQTLVRFPQTAERLRAVVTNGGNFGPRPTSIGWNLRYDPLAAAVGANSGVPWVLLPENATRFAGLREDDVRRLRDARTPLPELLVRAIDLWQQNKPDATPTPHLSDLNVFAYLLGGWLSVKPGRATLSLPPGRLGELTVEDDPEGPHLLGEEVPEDRGPMLRELFMKRVLGARDVGRA